MYLYSSQFIKYLFIVIGLKITKFLGVTNPKICTWLNQKDQVKGVEDLFN